MMTRSIVGRLLILAVLLGALGVIGQAAWTFSRLSGKAVAKAEPAPPVKLATAVPAEPAPAPLPAADPTPPAAAPVAAAAAQPADAAPIRVVYPGPLGDAPAPHKVAEAAPAVTAVPTSPPAAAPPPPPAAPAKTAAAPAAKPAAAVVASADADTQPSGAGKGGIDLNSASVDALNRLGGGHIGQAIVAHRPYRSVEDLVKKRIVRRSVYDQIKAQVAAD